MSDPYAQQRAIAQSALEAETRLERALILEKLDKLMALVEALQAKPAKAAKE